MMIRGHDRALPSWWGGAGISAKIAWVSQFGVPYPEACRLLSKCRRVRPEKKKQMWWDRD